MIKDYDIIVRIGSIGINEDEALDNVTDVLKLIRRELPLENYSIDVEEVGEYL